MKKYSNLAVVFVSIAFVLVSLESLAFASTGNKKLDKAIKAYTKNVEKAETKSCNTELGKSAKALGRSCAKEIKALDKRYEKYTDDIKADPTITSLNQRHEALRAIIPALEHQAAVDKVAQEYLRKIESMEKKECKKKDSYGEVAGVAALCLEQVEKADAIKARIPADLLQEPVIKAIVARHEELRKMPELMAENISGAQKAQMDKASLQGDFSNTVYDISYWNYLESGKANKPDDISYIEGLDKYMPRYKAFAADCKGKYAEYIKAKPENQAKCELAENAEKYRNQFAAASYQKFLKDEIKEINTVISRLKKDEDKFIEVPDYNRLVIGSKAYIQDMKTRIGESQKKVGLPEPSYAELESAVAEIPVAIKAAVKANNWDAKKTVPVAAPIEARTADIVKKKGLKLVKAGRFDEPWTIVKNGLGIPQYMVAKGWAMMKNPKESFCRMQRATYTRTYTGKDFAPASDVGFVAAIVPVKCK